MKLWQLNKVGRKCCEKRIQFVYAGKKILSIKTIVYGPLTLLEIIGFENRVKPSTYIHTFTLIFS